MYLGDQKGFSLVALLIAVAAIAIVGFVAWRIWDSSKTTDSSHAQQANDLPQNTSGGHDESAQQSSNEGYVVIKEWDVKFKPVEGLEGVEYFRPKDFGGAEAITFTTAALAEGDINCSQSGGNIVMGVLRRSKEKLQLGLDLGRINGYYYVYQYMQSACSDSKAVADLQEDTATKLVPFY